MNPRVSRSSAFTSKATGSPIAKVAAKLTVGYTLDEVINDITGSTPASFVAASPRSEAASIPAAGQRPARTPLMTPGIGLRTRFYSLRTEVKACKRLDLCAALK